jgi:hypothetical protein
VRAALGVLVAIALAGVCVGCPNQGDGAKASLGGLQLGGGGPAPSASSSASAFAIPMAPPGRCPEDAIWNGRFCLGHGYVACPGAARFDDAGACTTEPLGDARDASADR